MAAPPTKGPGACKQLWGLQCRLQRARRSWRVRCHLGDSAPTAASAQRARRRLGFPESAARKLSVEAVLRGHRGCVNRLAWNEAGTLLASGSDDRQVRKEWKDACIAATCTLFGV